MKMDNRIFIKWLKINILFFAGAFIAALILALVIPDIMLLFVRRWGAYTIAVGPRVLESTTKEAFFINILTRNSLMTILYFIASLFFLAPLLAIMTGTFYSLGLVSAIERGVSPFWHPPVLIAIEISLILLSVTFGSALGSEIFGTRPEGKEIIDFWKKNWKKLFPEQKRGWKVVFGENKKEFILFFVIISSLLLFGAWFEAFL